MSRPPMAARITRGTVLVAAVSALVLAAAAALTARVLWLAEQRQELRDAAGALVGAIDREKVEEHTTMEGAAPEALRESTTAGARVEVWSGSRLVAVMGNGPEIGAAGDEAGIPGWIVHRRPVADGLLLAIAVPAADARRALRVFAFSVLFAAPVCLAVALWVGRVVARRATRPLLDLQTRIQELGALEPLPPPAQDDAPAELALLEDAFRALWSRLQETVRREREFAANASHELRLPLARIRLLAERARAASPAAAGPALEAQMKELDRLVRLVESLLVLARDTSAGVPRGETVNVADVARRVGARLLDGSAQCVFPDEAIVRGDEDLIEIAVHNLLENARKFSAGPGPIQAVLSNGGDLVRLEVTTPGARIAALERERVFDRFYRAPEARGQSDGHGLGLALARHVARLHGGDVCCVSGEHEDARFRLDLPVWRAAQDPPTAG